MRPLEIIIGQTEVCNLQFLGSQEERAGLEVKKQD